MSAAMQRAFLEPSATVAVNDLCLRTAWRRPTSYGLSILAFALGMASVACGDSDEPNANAQEATSEAEAQDDDLGAGDGSDVVMIGDSWMSQLSAGSAIQGGVLKASGQPYRQYAIGGTTLLGGGASGLLAGFFGEDFEFLTIPEQYQKAVDENANIETVIMTGGGNDILQNSLQSDCEQESDACGTKVVEILDALSALWSDMAEDGVQDVIYILYATPAGESVDFALPDGDSAVARCAAVPAPLRCHIVETLDIVMGDIPDGIHPSQAASDRIGQAVYELMLEKGMRR
jgi:hypothetical protein